LKLRSPRKPVVLVVDDYAGIRELLHLMLDDDYKVAEAADGSEGVNIA
jgi:CheY-like chemotaxis protein